MTEDQIIAAAKALHRAYIEDVGDSDTDWTKFLGLASRALDGARLAVPLVAGESVMLDELPIPPGAPLRVRVTVESDVGDDLWWYYPLGWAFLGDRIRLDFRVGRRGAHPVVRWRHRLAWWR